jgi:chemotaxis protein MotA
MNPSTLIGMVASVFLLVVVLFFAAEDPLLFIDLPGLCIVLGGTMAATFLSYPLKEVVRVFKLINTVIRNERQYTQKDIEELVDISRLWIRDDPVAVEKALKRITNPFLRSGVQLVIERTPEEDILDLMQWRIARLKAQEAAEAQLFRVMASYAPAFGMVGTLVGLVNLMDILGGGDMQLIGRHLAVALMTTFYGILLANLVFKPVAVKLERRTEQRVVLMNMVMQGIAMMTAKRSPSLMRETLKSFVAYHEDEIFDGADPSPRGGTAKPVAPPAAPPAAARPAAPASPSGQPPARP